MKKALKTIGIVLLTLMIILCILIFIVIPQITKPRTELSPLASEWQESGQYIKWTSIIEENKAFGEQNVFTIQKGDPNNLAILLIHGYPTMSFDFYDLAELLSAEYYVCAIDTIAMRFPLLQLLL